jgi:hypothetical protein
MDEFHGKNLMKAEIRFQSNPVEVDQVACWSIRPGDNVKVKILNLLKDKVLAGCR